MLIGRVMLGRCRVRVMLTSGDQIKNFSPELLNKVANEERQLGTKTEIAQSDVNAVKS